MTHGENVTGDSVYYTNTLNPIHRAGGGIHRGVFLYVTLDYGFNVLGVKPNMDGKTPKILTTRQWWDFVVQPLQTAVEFHEVQKADVQFLLADVTVVEMVAFLVAYHVLIVPNKNHSFINEFLPDIGQFFCQGVASLVIGHFAHVHTDEKVTRMFNHIKILCFLALEERMHRLFQCSRPQVDPKNDCPVTLKGECGDVPPTVRVKESFGGFRRSIHGRVFTAMAI